MHGWGGLGGLIGLGDLVGLGVLKNKNLTNSYKNHDKNLKGFPVYDCLKKKCATFTTQYTGGCSIIWMTTQEPPFTMPLTGSQKPPSFRE